MLTIIIGASPSTPRGGMLTFVQKNIPSCTISTFSDHIMLTQQTVCYILTQCTDFVLSHCDIVTWVPMEELHFGKLIGQGSYGKVHKGLWNGSTVALKRMKLPNGDGGSLLAPKEVEILKLVSLL